MLQASIYIYVIILFLLNYLIKEGYWQGFSKSLITEVRNNTLSGVLVL